MTPAPATQAEARNFRVEVADGIATVLIDEPGEPVNTLSDEVGEEFDRILTGLGKDPSVKAVVFGRPYNPLGVSKRETIGKGAPACSSRI